MRGIIFPIYDPSYQEEETLQQQDLNNNAKDDIATEDQPAEDEEGSLQMFYYSLQQLEVFNRFF